MRGQRHESYEADSINMKTKTEVLVAVSVLAVFCLAVALSSLWSLLTGQQETRGMYIHIHRICSIYLPFIPFIKLFSNTVRHLLVYHTFDCQSCFVTGSTVDNIDWTLLHGMISIPLHSDTGFSLAQ